jgi:hypothetical protein
MDPRFRTVQTKGKMNAEPEMAHMYAEAEHWELLWIIIFFNVTAIYDN